MFNLFQKAKVEKYKEGSRVNVSVVDTISMVDYFRLTSSQVLNSDTWVQAHTRRLATMICIQQNGMNIMSTKFEDVWLEGYTKKDWDIVSKRRASFYDWTRAQNYKRKTLFDANAILLGDYVDELEYAHDDMNVEIWDEFFE